MEISRSAATAKGPAETFTGDVWVDPITRGLPPSRLNVAAVRFTPGARSAWHSHDGGQTLYVTEGRGLVQVRGQEIVELNAGDVVFAPDGEEHWHGTRPDSFMTHLSITEDLQAHLALFFKSGQNRAVLFESKRRQRDLLLGVCGAGAKKFGRAQQASDLLGSVDGWH